MIWHSATAEQVANELNTNISNGLTTKEAELRLEKYGENTLRGKKGKSPLQLFLSSFKGVTLIVLLVAVIWFITSLLLHTGRHWNALVIVAVTLIGVVVDVVKEVCAENALDDLRNRSGNTAVVLRNGKEMTLPVAHVVPGDVLCLKKGDYIPADARLITATQLRCDEGPLTGEPVAVEKSADELLSDIVPTNARVNMVYSGCAVVHGSATAVVVGTGTFAEAAKIAKVVEDTTQLLTPLQKSWKDTSKTIGVAAAAVSVVIFILGLLLSSGSLFERLASAVMTCVALAASAVPESLAATITTLLAVGVNRMVRHKMPVRSLSAVETLGKVSVICTDKTGTLTTNRMTMTQMYAGGHTISLDNETTLSEGEKDFLLMAAMCCDADVQMQDGKEKFIGDHTEAGIVAAVTKHANIDKLTVDSIYPRLCELPFDAYRKLKTSVNMINGKPVAVVKGAADIIISRCDKCDKEAVTKAAEDMAEQALRVIGIAFKPLHEVPANPTEEELEHNLIFGGLVGLEDPPIPETAAAIADAKAAGVRVVMMTGDQEATAIASALRLGIVKKTSGVVINDVLDTMTDEQLDQAINGFGVFVRLTPENKERVVASLQRVGHVVAVTGDRVEDAGVLRLADVGCAMGKGAGVAQEAADVTVEDDNFATIMHGVGVGRGVYANICKTVRVTLGFVLGMGFMMLLSLLFGGGLPFNAVQIMWLNFLVATASVLPLGLELPAKNLLRQPPRTHDEILEKGSITKTLIHGGILAVCAFVAYQLGKETGSSSTMAFLSLGFGQLLCAFSFRSEESLLNFKHHHFNWWLMLSTVLAMVSLVLVFKIPALSTLFGVTTLTAEQKTIVAVTSVAPFIVREIAKFPKSFMNMGKR